MEQSARRWRLEDQSEEVQRQQSSIGLPVRQVEEEEEESCLRERDALIEL